MLEPWAEISERLRRIHQNFKLTQYREAGVGGLRVCRPNGKIFQRRNFAFFVEQGRSIAVVY